MNDVYQQLLQSYRCWSDWTDAETEAIERSDWARLEACQRQKTLLQTEIRGQERVLNSLRIPAWREQLRPMLEKLLRQEQLNKERLHRKRLVAEQQRTQAQIVGRTLRRLHGAYVSAHPVGWQSYS